MAGATVLLLWVVAGFAGVVGSGVVGLVLVLGTLGAGLMAARMLVGVISHRLGGSCSCGGTGSCWSRRRTEHRQAGT